MEDHAQECYGTVAVELCTPEVEHGGLVLEDDVCHGGCEEVEVYHDKQGLVEEYDILEEVSDE